ncbi:hypothetical protein Tco_1369615 [Tanacetum coccineum]
MDLPYVVVAVLAGFTMKPEKNWVVLERNNIRSVVTNSAGNASDKSSYANVTGKPSGKKLNIRTLFIPGGNGIDVVVPVESIRAISDRFANTTYGFFLGKLVAYQGVMGLFILCSLGGNGLVHSMFSSSTGLLSFQFSSMERLDAMLENVWVKLHGVPVTAFSNDGLSVIATKPCTPLMLDSYTSDMCMQSWDRSSYARVIIELRADVELKDNTVVVMPRIKGEGNYICASKKKTAKKPSQTSRGVPVGPKMSFKPQKEYRPVSKKHSASSSSNKKKGVEPTIEVSNSNPFEVLNLVDNDVELDNNANLVNSEATSIGSSFKNVDNSSSGTTLILEKIRKFEELLTNGQAILMDDVGNPLKKVEFSGDYDSEDEVASVDNDMTRSLALERVGFGTQILLEQWRDSYGNGDYDVDPYDDDMYDGQDLPQELQAICDNLDIQV